jgi:hypothetical protein
MKAETAPRLGKLTTTIFLGGILILFLSILINHFPNPSLFIILSFLICASSTFFSPIPIYARFLTSIGAAVIFGIALFIATCISMWIWGVPPGDGWGSWDY